MLKPTRACIGRSAQWAIECVLASALFFACDQHHPGPPGEHAPEPFVHELPKGFTREATEDTTIWLYHYEDLLFEGDSDAPFAVVPVGQKDPWARDITVRDTLYQDKRFMIRGDLRRTDMVFRRYVRALKPEQFPAKPYSGRLADPRIDTDPKARGFRTMIREGCAMQGVNFAGHYTIAEWGCGAMCAMLAVVDRMDGSVYFTGIPFDTLDGHYGAQYTLDSRLIVVNSELTTLRPGYRTLMGGQWPSSYVWNEDRKRFELIETVNERP